MIEWKNIRHIAHFCAFLDKLKVRIERGPSNMVVVSSISSISTLGIIFFAIGFKKGMNNFYRVYIFTTGVTTNRDLNT